jgi:hypothetical protein
VTPYRLVLPLITDDGADAGSLTCVVEFWLAPGARHHLSTPADPTPRRLIRILQQGRPHGVAFTPGYQVLELVALELEPAPVSERARLEALGWQAAR